MKAWYWLWIVGGVILGGFAAFLIGAGEISAKADWKETLGARLQLMFVLAVFIERSVEVYLNALEKNGPDRFAGAQDDGRSAAQAAALASVTLGLLVALVGVRLLGAVVMMPTDDYPRFLLVGVDIVISGGLLAGGSALFHEVSEAIRGGLTSVSQIVGPKGTETSKVRATAAYSIEIRRNAKDRGVLSFAGGGTQVVAPCWWNPNAAIAAGTYRRCSKVRMATKTDSTTGERRPAIWLPEAVVPHTDNHSIFIHEGMDASELDGCIAVERALMIRLWEAVTPENAGNITVTITDA